MKKLLNGVAYWIAFVVAGGATFYVLRAWDPFDLVTPEAQPAQAQSVPAPREPASTEPAPTDGLFHVDADRLYDLSYETDPALVAFAKEAGKTPACVIALHKLAAWGEEVPAEACPEPEPAADVPVLNPGPDHPFANLTDAQLEGLINTSAEAAIILARRLEDDATAGRLYERAVVLSGQPAPLAEWMTQRRLGGLSYEEGSLDVELARVGYEVHLVMARLGVGADDVAFYEEHLRAAGIPLAPIRDRAQQRFRRMTAERQALTGNGWTS